MEISEPSFGALRPGARHHQGITLAEVLISLAILVLTGVGSVSGFMLLNRYATTNRDRAAAKALCQERIEQIVSLPFRPKDGIVPQTSNEAVTLDLQPNGAATALTPVTGTRTTTVAVANAALCLVRVTVTVTWTNRSDTNSYTLYALRGPD